MGTMAVRGEILMVIEERRESCREERKENSEISCERQVYQGNKHETWPRRQTFLDYLLLHTN